MLKFSIRFFVTILKPSNLMSPSSDEQKWLKFTRNFNYPKQKLNHSFFQLLWEENELMTAYIAYLSTIHTHEKANETLMLMLLIMYVGFQQNRKRIFWYFGSCIKFGYQHGLQCKSFYLNIEHSFILHVINWFVFHAFIYFF